MTGTPNADPSLTGGQPAQPTDANAPAQADNASVAQPQGGTPTDYLREFVDAGGNIDKDKVANAIKSYNELKGLYGRQTNELGELRSTKERYETFYQSEYVEDPERPGQAIHRLELDARQARNRPAYPEQGQMSREEAAEKLRELMEDDPIAYHKWMLDTAKTEALREISQRDAVYTSPAAQKIITDYPDVRPRAEQISFETGVPLERALKEAVGEKLLEMATSGTRPQGTPPLNANLGNLTTPMRTFMAPQGKIPDQKPASRLTAEQIARGREYGFSPEDLEPFADREQK